MQTCVDFGARYGKFDVKSVAFKRKAVTNEAVQMAKNLKEVGTYCNRCEVTAVCKHVSGVS